MYWDIGLLCRWMQRLSLCLCVMSMVPLAVAWGQTPPVAVPSRPPGIPSEAPGGPGGTPPLPPRPVPMQPRVPASSPAAVPPRTAAPVATAAEITVHNDTMSVQLRGHDLQSVIRTIASQGHIEVKHLESLPNKPVSMTFTDVSIISGLKRLLRAADVTGYVLVTGKDGDVNKVQRLVFVPSDDIGSSPGGRGAQQRSAAGTSPRQALTPPIPPPAAPPASSGRPTTDTEEGRPPATPGSSASVFEDLKTNAAAKRLVSQLMHPNEQVRERAFESLVRLVGEDDKQRELLEFLEPLMEDLSSEDKQTQEDARGEIRKLLSQ